MSTLLLWLIEWNSSTDFHVGDHFDSKGVGLFVYHGSLVIGRFFDFDFFLLEIQDSDNLDSGFHIQIELVYGSKFIV